MAAPLDWIVPWPATILPWAGSALPATAAGSAAQAAGAWCSAKNATEIASSDVPRSKDWIVMACPYPRRLSI